MRARGAFDIGGRLGYILAPSTLVYAAGGYTRAGFTFNYSDEYSTRRTFDGWFAGAGIEQQIAGPWTLKLEYRFSQYGKEQFGFVPPPVVTADSVTHSTNADVQTIRLGLDFRFNAGP